MATQGIPELKLLQMNIWAGKLGNQIVDLVKSERPDIVCLQEVSSYPGDPGAYFASMEEIQNYCDLPYGFMSPVFAFKFMSGTVKFGNAILSKSTLNDQETVFTSLEYKDNFDFSHDGYNIRNFQHASQNIDGKALHIVNHHGYHVRSHKDGNEETERQMKQIADYIDNLHGPTILTGDFNLSPTSPSLAHIHNRLQNLSVEYNLKTTRNLLTTKTEVCDYIFVSEDVKVQNFYMCDKIASDHQALVLEFDV